MVLPLGSVERDGCFQSVVKYPSRARLGRERVASAKSEGNDRFLRSEENQEIVVAVMLTTTAVVSALRSQDLCVCCSPSSSHDQIRSNILSC